MENSFAINYVSIDWRLKALLQFAFSLIPRGEQLNYFVQRYVAKSLPASDNEFAATVSYAKRHIDSLRRFYDRPVTEATFYEFGAGWDLTIPLTLYGFGVENQIVVDIRNLLRRDILNLTIEKYQNWPLQYAMERTPVVQCDDSRRDLTMFLREQYGIDYHAPCDARQTELQSASVDCITSTSTLEHISIENIRLILRECRRILSNNGLMSFLINYDDHYSYFDSNISSYNFLKYSDRHWAFFNPPLHYQNRMRHNDYSSLFESEGFEILEEQATEGREAELKIFEHLRIADRFKMYKLSHLAVRNALFVLRKKRKHKISRL